jgi:hypothetical protein
MSNIIWSERLCVCVHEPSHAALGQSTYIPRHLRQGRAAGEGAVLAVQPSPPLTLVVNLVGAGDEVGAQQYATNYDAGHGRLRVRGIQNALGRSKTTAHAPPASNPNHSAVGAHFQLKLG